MAARKRASVGPRPSVRKPMRISENVWRLPTRQGVDPFVADHSKLHPPGVGPRPVPGMAMDDAYGAFAVTSAQRVEYLNALMSIADDMTRKWIEFKAKAGLDKTERIEALKDKFEAIKVQSEVKAHIVQALGFGRAHLYLDTRAVANLIVAEQARKGGTPISFWSYFKVGAPLTVLTLAAGTAWLSIR